MDLEAQVCEADIIKGLKMMIDGHLLLQSPFIDPDHPSYNHRQVVVIFQIGGGIPAIVQEKITAKYKDKGWHLEFGQDWKSGGPWILCTIEDPGTQEERMARITAKFKKLGHNMSEWRDANGRYFCRCNNSGCELDIMFSIHQGGAFYFVGPLPMQSYYECPADI